MQVNAATIDSKSFLERLKSWSRAELMSPFVIGGNCCSSELNRLSGPNPQAAKIRENFIDNKTVDSCDVLIVSGIINEKVEPYLLDLYDSLKSPKFVVAVGMCSCTGALFETKPLSDLMPVDISIGGCPPSLESLKEGIEVLRSKIRRGDSLSYEGASVES